MHTALDLGVVGRHSCGGAIEAWAVALAVCLQLPAACDTASGSGMHTGGRLSGAAQEGLGVRGRYTQEESAAVRHLSLRGGSSAPGYSGLPDEELFKIEVEEVR